MDKELTVEQQNVAPVEHTPAKTLHLPKHRKRSGGELLFDGVTYGGLGMVGNEIASTSIVELAKRENIVGRAFKGMQHLVERGPDLPYLRQRASWTTFALGGGMLMVPLIKLMEDHKGGFVRWADRLIHGKRSDTDPQMQRVHDEMDRTPRQTWASLWKGRAVTVATAFVVDMAFIWKNAWTSKLFKEGSRASEFSTLERISDKVADGIGGSIAKHRPNMTAQSLETTKSWLRNGVGLFAFTSVLAALFYSSSKLFARRQEQSREMREIYEEHQREIEPTEAPRAHVHGHSRDEVTREEKDEAPGATVHAVNAQDRVAASEQQLGSGA